MKDLSSIDTWYSYSIFTLSSFKAGFVYIFNLIVGAGALALPKAFGGAGLLLSAIIVVILAFLR